MQLISWIQTQHEKFGAHTSGNTLDLIFMEVISETGIADCKPDSLSDHFNVLCKLMLKRENILRKTSTYRKLKDVHIDKMAKCVKATSRRDGYLDERVLDLNKALINVLNIHAPLQTKQITIHRRVPWYTDEVRELKKIFEKKTGHLHKI